MKIFRFEVESRFVPSAAAMLAAFLAAFLVAPAVRAQEWATLAASPQIGTLLTFGTRSDGTFVSCAVNGNDPSATWTSTSHGKPGGVGSTGLPSIHWHTDYSAVYAFTRTIGGNLWVRWAEDAFNDSTPAWNWTNAGKPSPSAIASDPASVSYGGKEYAFVIGDDQHLRAVSGPSWVWSDHGTPGVGLAGRPAAVRYLDNLYIYVVGTDGQLYLRYWNGVFWSWGTVGTPPGGVTMVGPPTAFTFGTNIEIFVAGSDRHLYRRNWNGSTWQWNNQGVAAGMGAPDSARFDGKFRDEIFAFALQLLPHATEPTLLGNFWSSTSNTWELASHDAPAGQTLLLRQPAMAGSFAGEIETYPTWRVSVFALGKNDRVFRRWYGPGSHGIWSWTWSTKFCQM